ncbi:MAG: UvrB/UvrC motif-containing protein [Gemmatimonadota bacterium]
MRCDNCRERQAEIHLTQIENSELTTLHLCPTCANEKGLGGAALAGKVPLADFLAQIGKGREETPPAAPAEPCPYCGTSAADFRKSGRLGCAQCYAHFEPQLRALLRRLHGSTQHVGRLYLSEGSEVSDRLARLAGLRRRLQQAIETEDFESAAELRDRIHELEAAR